MHQLIQYVWVCQENKDKGESVEFEPKVQSHKTAERKHWWPQSCSPHWGRVPFWSDKMLVDRKCKTEILCRCQQPLRKLSISDSVTGFKNTLYLNHAGDWRENLTWCITEIYGHITMFSATGLTLSDSSCWIRWEKCFLLVSYNHNFLGKE